MNEQPPATLKRRVLAAVDYSPCSRAAFDRALTELARDPRAELHVVTVAERDSPLLDEATTGSLDRRFMEESKATLRDYALERALVAFPERISELRDRIVSHARIGIPAYEIVGLARELEADLIVTGTHGRRGMRRFVLGSVAEEVVRRAGCPVLVVRSTETSAAA